MICPRRLRGCSTATRRSGAGAGIWQHWYPLLGNGTRRNLRTNPLGSGRGVVRNATNGRIVGAGEATLPFTDDVTTRRAKSVFRQSYLLRPQTLALLQARNRRLSRGKEIGHQYVAPTGGRCVWVCQHRERTLPGTVPMVLVNSTVSPKPSTSVFLPCYIAALRL